MIKYAASLELLNGTIYACITVVVVALVKAAYG
jgi:hypothetical protein